MAKLLHSYTIKSEPNHIKVLNHYGVMQLKADANLFKYAERSHYIPIVEDELYVYLLAVYIVNEKPLKDEYKHNYNFRWLFEFNDVDDKTVLCQTNTVFRINKDNFKKQVKIGSYTLDGPLNTFNREVVVSCISKRLLQQCINISIINMDYDNNVSTCDSDSLNNPIIYLPETDKYIIYVDHYDYFKKGLNFYHKYVDKTKHNPAYSVVIDFAKLFFTQYKAKKISKVERNHLEPWYTNTFRVPVDIVVTLLISAAFGEVINISNDVILACLRSDYQVNDTSKLAVTFIKAVHTIWSKVLYHPESVKMVDWINYGSLLDAIYKAANFNGKVDNQTDILVFEDKLRSNSLKGVLLNPFKTLYKKTIKLLSNPKLEELEKRDLIIDLYINLSKTPIFGMFHDVICHLIAFHLLTRYLYPFHDYIFFCPLMSMEEFKQLPMNSDLDQKSLYCQYLDYSITKFQLDGSNTRWRDLWHNKTLENILDEFKEYLSK